MVRHLPLNITELKSRRRDLPERHRSLKAAIDWSYQSLSPNLQSLFLDLCAFRGGFELDSLTQVCLPDSDLTQAWESLNSLLERSLVRLAPSEESQSPRFRLLMAFREFAVEHIPSQRLSEVKERHANYFARQSNDEPFRSVQEQTARHLAIELDYDNYLAAVEFSLKCDDLERAVSLLQILATRWLTRGPRSAETNLIKEMANHPDAQSLSVTARVKLLRMLGTTYIRTGNYLAAYQACTEAVQIAESVGDRELLATCYSGLSVCAGFLSRLQECLELNQKVLDLVGDENLVLAERSYLGIGSALWNFGELDRAAESFNRARQISEKLRGGEPDALIVINQARVAVDQNRLDEGFRLAHEAIRTSKRLHDDFTLAVAMTVVSRYHSQRQNFEAASATNLEALQRFKQGDFVYWILQCLRIQALIWIEQKRYAEAATLFAASSELTSSERRFDSEEDRKALETIQSALTPNEYETAWARGLMMERGEAVHLAFR
jgi:non-specific serine/threonine protein kinase